MPDPVEQGARAAAQRLMPAHGSRLEADVEAAIYTRGTNAASKRDRYIDPVGLAGLIVAAADLAWSVYTDLRSKSDTRPGTQAVALRVRNTLRETRTLEEGTQQVIEIVVEETLRALPDTNQD